MRALCGAIITAGSLIGMGLAAIGLGTRYSRFDFYGKDEKPQWVEFWQMDVGLIIVIVLLVGALIVGLGIAILGLAYHHHRRHLEHLHMHRHPQEGSTQVPVT